MTQFFEHEPQTTSTVNQVENLATEVNEAFNLVEVLLYQDNSKNASIASSIGDLDNKYIKEYVPNNGWISNYQQTLYFPQNSQSASLDLYPSTLLEDINTISVSNLTNPSKTYMYKIDGVLETETDFTFSERKVIFGQAPTDSESLVITYKGFNTTTPEDNSNWPFELKYNVLQIKRTDNSILKDFTFTQSGNEVTISGYDFKSLCSTEIQDIINNAPQDLDKYVAIYDGDERLEASNIQITSTFVRFTTTDVITGTTLKVYAANSSLGKLIECLYRLFYAHDHGSNGGQGVNHNSLLGLYKNEEESGIHYQVTNKPNYDHPQYFNREGYIQDSTVYNNAILGDILLASTADSNRNNNLDGSSVKLIFGEYSSGPRMYYNYEDDCLWLDSISRDGVKVVTAKEMKAISINDHSFIDTQYVTNSTDNALKLAVKSNDGNDLGVFKLTRKIVNNGVATDDDYAIFLSYASEFSHSKIKEKLTIDNGAKISFGDPGIIDMYLDETGLHFKTEGEGELTEVSTVNFDVPVKASKITADHLDVKDIHLTENQKLSFGSNSHGTENTQYMNFKNNKLNLKTTNSFVVANNGRHTGISLDERQYIYTATPQGYPILDAVEFTDLFVETKRDTYFIQSGYTYNPGITSLHQVPRSDVYCGNNYADNVRIVYNEDSTNGLVLNNNNKMFAQRDLSDNIATIIQGNNGLIVASSYNPVGPVINYGKVTAKTFNAVGNKDTDAGFYGNIIVPVNHRITINGTTEFNSDITFSKPVTFTDKVTANTIDAGTVQTNNLIVDEKATFDEIEVLEELRFNTMLQTNRVANSEFAGTVQFNNNVTMPDSNNFLVIGNKEIEDTRKTSGLMLSNNEVKLGVNGQMYTGKMFASKGSPSGNGDTTGGYSFSSTNGATDGDTGMFCENNIEEQSNSDIVFRIDGVEKGRFSKEGVDFNALDLSDKQTVIVTLDMLLSQLGNINANTLDITYPVGSVYENSLDGRNPAVIFEWPTSIWKRYAVGRTLIGASGTGVGEQVDDYLTVPAGLNLNSAGTKVGNFTHTLTTAELPKTEVGTPYVTSKDGWGDGIRDVADPSVHSLVKTMELGLGQSHNIMQPSIVTHIWERIG